MSFQSQPWELYNLAEDRTELHNLAAKHPDILARMVKQSHEMTAKVLHAPAKERAPVAETATSQQNPRWSDYTGTKSPKADGTEKKKRPKKPASPVAPMNPETK